MAGRKKKQRPFTKGPICFRKAPYVSERTYMFQKNPICLKKRPICCPYVVLSEGFSSPYVEKAPYVAKQVPICGPYAAHIRPICFGCSCVSLFLSLSSFSSAPHPSNPLLRLIHPALLFYLSLSSFFLVH